MNNIIESRGKTGQAAGSYAAPRPHIRQHPDDYDAKYPDSVTELFAKLDPPYAEN